MKNSIKKYKVIITTALVNIAIILFLFYCSMIGKIAYDTIRNNNLQKKQILKNIQTSIRFYENRSDIVNKLRIDNVRKFSELVYTDESDVDEALLNEYFAHASVENIIILDSKRTVTNVYGCNDYSISQSHFNDSYYDSIFADVDAGSTEEINVTSLKDYAEDAFFIKVKDGYWVYVLPKEKNVNDEKYFWEITLENTRVGEYSNVGVIDKTTGKLIYCWDDTLEGKIVNISKENGNWGKIDEDTYYITHYRIDDIPADVVALTSISDIYGMIKDRLISVGVLVFIAATIMIALIVFLREEEIDAKEEIRFLGKYFLKTQLKKYAIVGVLVSTLLYCSLMLVSELDYMTRVETDLNSQIDKTIKLFDDYYDDTILIDNMTEEKYYMYGRLIDVFIKHNPDYITKDGLKYIANLFEVSDISIFDSQGETVCTSSPLDHLAVLSDNESSLYDLRYVLMGKENIKVDADTRIQPDDISVYAVPRRDEKKIAVGILAIDAVKKKIDRVEPRGLLQDSSGLVQSCVDKDGTIILFYDSKFVGKNISNIGISEDMIYDGYSGKFKYNNKNYAALVKSSKAGYTLLVDQYNEFSVDVIGNAFLSTIMFIIAILIFAYDGLGSKHQFKNSNQVKNKSNRSDKIKKWTNLDAIDKIKRVMIFYVHCFSAYFIFAQWMIVNGIGTHDTINYIFNGDWERSVNIFSVVCNIFTIMIYYSVIKWFDTVLIRVATMSKQSGETISRLIANIIKYLGVIFCVYQIAMNSGVDAKTALTSIGIAGFGLTFGAQDMIKDVIAGIFIFFEGSYRVGDMLLIDGGWFWVKSIGIRATRVEAWGQVKVINNSQMTKVVNIQNSSDIVDCDVYVGKEYRLEDIEEILKYELSLLRDNYPEGISLPRYMGVKDVDANGYKICIRTYAPPMLKEKMTRRLKEDVMRIFDKYIESGKRDEEKEKRSQSLRDKAEKIRENQKVKKG